MHLLAMDFAGVKVQNNRHYSVTTEIIISQSVEKTIVYKDYFCILE